MRASAIVLVGLTACLSNPVADRHIPEPDELGRRPFGSWAVAEDDHGRRIDGELIAIDRGAVYLLGERAVLSALPTTALKKLTLVAYNAKSGGLVGWGVLGYFSTVGNGWFAVFTAPPWLVTTIIVSVVEHNAPIYQYPDTKLDVMQRYARFPQGLPPRFDPARLGR
jgi:hypothetical protein